MLLQESSIGRSSDAGEPNVKASKTGESDFQRPLRPSVHNQGLPWASSSGDLGASEGVDGGATQIGGGGNSNSIVSISVVGSGSSNDAKGKRPNNTVQVIQSQPYGGGISSSGSVNSSTVTLSNLAKGTTKGGNQVVVVPTTPNKKAGSTGTSAVTAPSSTTLKRPSAPSIAISTSSKINKVSTHDSNISKVIRSHFCERVW